MRSLVLTCTLEEDSNKILREHGMEFVEVVEDDIAWMLGGNRIGEDGKPSYKNAVQVDGKWFKYEPIFVWKKPAFKQKYPPKSGGKNAEKVGSKKRV